MVETVALLMNKLGAVAPTKGAATYLAAVLEYMLAELIELSGNRAKDAQRDAITPSDILLAVSNDEELMQMFLGNSPKSDWPCQGAVVNGGFVTRPDPLLDMIAAGAVPVLRDCLAECPHLLAERLPLSDLSQPVTPLEFACINGFYDSAVALVEWAPDMAAFGSVRCNCEAHRMCSH